MKHELTIVDFHTIGHPEAGWRGECTCGWAASGQSRERIETEFATHLSRHRATPPKVDDRTFLIGCALANSSLVQKISDVGMAISAAEEVLRVKEGMGDDT